VVTVQGRSRLLEECHEKGIRVFASTIVASRSSNGVLWILGMNDGLKLLKGSHNLFCFYKVKKVHSRLVARVVNV